MRLSAVLAALAIALLGRVAHAQTVTVYTSANFAPLMVGNGRGLYPDLVAYLNLQHPGGLHFKLAYLPRKRLQVKLEDGSIDGIVIGMMPEWFDDAAQTKYLWTAPFAYDRFTLVSRSARPLDPERGDKLEGATIGLALGYVYPGIDTWMARHHMVRNNAPSEETSLDKLVLGRIDAVVVAESIARYYIKKHALSGQLQIHALPLEGAERRFLVPHAQRGVFEQIAPLVRKLKDDPAWQQRSAAYQ